MHQVLWSSQAVRCVKFSRTRRAARCLRPSSCRGPTVTSMGACDPAWRAYSTCLWDAAEESFLCVSFQGVLPAYCSDIGLCRTCLKQHCHSVVLTCSSMEGFVSCSTGWQDSLTRNPSVAVPSALISPRLRLDIRVLGPGHMPSTTLKFIPCRLVSNTFHPRSW